MFDIKNLKNELKNNFDVCVRDIVVCDKKISLIFLKSTIDKMLFVKSVISPLLDYNGKISLQILKEKVLKVVEIEEITKEDFAKNVILNKVVLILEGEEKALTFDVSNIPKRQPSEPPTSPTINGPRQGFTEDIETTVAMLRKQIASKHFVVKNFKVGAITHSKVCLFYLDNIANLKIVKNLEKQIKNINIDGVLDVHYLAEFLAKKPNSIFEQAGFCEKPDIVTSKILEGRIAIAVDGSPIVLTVPYMLIEDLQNSNDYYVNSHYATFIRYIRSLAIILATVVPGVYLSFRLYHYRILPLKYILTINATTQNLPFTPIIELLFILILFQILYEVSLRLPRYLGLATSIVGALVLGDTGVSAGLISPPGIIVIALSLIAVYAIPNQAPQLSLLRFVFLLIGGTLGLLGIIGTMIYLITYLCSLNVYNTSYLAPYAPKVKSDLKDGLKRKPVMYMKYRPKSLDIKDNIRGVNKNESNNS